jgi:hypothetical protein
MSHSGYFVTIQAEKGGRIVTATLRLPLGLDGLTVPGDSVWRRNVTVVSCGGCFVGDEMLLGCSELGRFVKAPV